MQTASEPNTRQDQDYQETFIMDCLCNLKENALNLGLPNRGK